jgi:hypothetical protein
MLSKYKLTRQIPLTTTYYDATIVANNPDKYAFAFYPTSGQGVYAGVNTTKGYMAAGASDSFLGGSLITSIQEAVSKAGGAHMVVLRDLGKTIYTVYYTNTLESKPPPPPISKGYFRQVLGHALSQSGHEDTFASSDNFRNTQLQIINLIFRWNDPHGWIK